MNTAERILARIADLEQTKAENEKLSREKIAEIEAAIAKQDRRQETAIMECDIDGYKMAQTELDNLSIELEMYKRKKHDNGVTEAESEAVIIELLDYERSLDDGFRETAGAILMQLKSELDAYSLKIAQTENAIREWSSKVRPNYYNPDTVYPNGTHKSDRPVTIHAFGYFGIPEAGLIDTYLRIPMISRILRSVKDDADIESAD